MSRTHVPAELRRWVRERAHGCCEYCLTPESAAFAAHEVDHIIDEKHGGQTDAARGDLRRRAARFASLIRTSRSNWRVSISPSFALGFCCKSPSCRLTHVSSSASDYQRVVSFGSGAGDGLTVDARAHGQRWLPAKSLRDWHPLPKPPPPLHPPQWRVALRNATIFLLRYLRLCRHRRRHSPRTHSVQMCTPSRDSSGNKIYARGLP